MRRIIWLYGRPGAGKTTISVALRAALTALGHTVCLLDSDHMRRGPNIDLGFDDDDRAENVKRLALFAMLLSRLSSCKDPFVIVSAVTPKAEHRRLVASFCDPLLVYVNARESKEPWLGTVFEVDDSRPTMPLPLVIPPGWSPDDHAARIVDRLRLENLLWRC